jgi:hypothetical protein
MTDDAKRKDGDNYPDRRHGRLNFRHSAAMETAGRQEEISGVYARTGIGPRPLDELAR